MIDSYRDFALQTGILNSVILAVLDSSAIVAIVGALAVVVVGVIAAIPPSMLAYAALKQAKLNADAAEKANAATNAELKSVGETTTKIHELTNSQLSDITTQLKVAMEEIRGLKQTALAISKERLVSDKERAETRSRADVENGASNPDAPLPVADAQVADLLRGEVRGKLDDIQSSVDEAKPSAPALSDEAERKEEPGWPG